LQRLEEREVGVWQTLSSLQRPTTYAVERKDALEIVLPERLGLLRLPRRRKLKA